MQSSICLIYFLFRNDYLQCYLIASRTQIGIKIRQPFKQVDDIVIFQKLNGKDVKREKNYYLPTDNNSLNIIQQYIEKEQRARNQQQQQQRRKNPIFMNQPIFML